MTHIDGNALRQVRTQKKWSQEELSRRSKINKQTIYRLECGRTTRANERTVKELSSALRVSPAVLAGEAPVPERTRRPSPLDIGSEMTLRYSHRSRNALSLAAARYRVSAAQILEVAPFLFVCAAEASLQRRRDRLQEIEQRRAELSETQANFPHLSGLLTWNTRADDIIDAERQSIAKRDLFGATIRPDDAIINTAAVEDIENPFAVFLRDQGEQSNGVADFEAWPYNGRPCYKAGTEEALGLVGQDEEAAFSVLAGIAVLHQMPKEVLAGGPEARATWARDAGQAFLSAFEGLERDGTIVYPIAADGEVSR